MFNNVFNLFIYLKQAILCEKNMHAVTINGCGSFVAAYFDETYREFKTACIVIECTIREIHLNNRFKSTCCNDSSKQRRHHILRERER